jgi:hypothetical protein
VRQVRHAALGPGRQFDGWVGNEPPPDGGWVVNGGRMWREGGVSPAAGILAMYSDALSHKQACARGSCLRSTLSPSLELRY